MRISHKREDTFIAGLSMGGFGALRTGFLYPQNFSHVAGFSSALHLFEMPFDQADRNIGSEDASFGDIREAVKTDKNPRVALEHLKEKREQDASIVLPRVYLSCGTEDRLVTYARLYRNLMQDAGFDVTYYEGPGMHNWDFWNQELEKALDWLPLETEK